SLLSHVFCVVLARLAPVACSSGPRSSLVFFFFFFQAEDGIRDRNVTGVQTCALPILPPAARRWARVYAPMGQSTRKSPLPRNPRSEERRVGKESRSRWSPDQ